jgi:predicted ATP-grasp superfamily ATP-dependent carboligase
MKRIWVIGASARALAQSLAAQGHEVIAADLFNDLDLQRIARTQRIVDYPHDLLKLIDSVAADAFVYTGGLENYPDLIDQLAERIPLIGNPGRVLRRVRDVSLLRDTLERGGFEMPETVQSLPDGGNRRWLRKSVSSSGGLRVSWASRGGSPLRPGEYFQECIDGPVYGASFFSSGEGTQLLGVARQLTDCAWTNAPAFQYAGSVGPICLAAGLHCEIVRLGQFLVSEFKLNGWFGVDFLVDANQHLWILEVNPRYTASMELLQRGKLSGKVIFYAWNRLVVTSALSQRLYDRGDVADIPCPGSEISAGSPAFTVLAEGESEPVVIAGLQSKAESLQQLVGDGYPDAVEG